MKLPFWKEKQKGRKEEKTKKIPEKFLIWLGRVELQEASELWAPKLAKEEEQSSISISVRGNLDV